MPSTSTATNTSTATSTVTGTSTETGTATATATATATNTGLPASPTSSSTGTQAATATYPPTSTATRTSTATGTGTSTPTATASATGTPAECGTFTGEQPGSTFYQYIQCLACQGVVSGYPDGSYREGEIITRGQIAKIVSNAAGFNEDPGNQIYTDVPPGSPFYPYINRLTHRNIVAGYPCPQRPGGGGADGDDDCTPEDSSLYRPNMHATRGQLAKIVSNASGYDEAISGQHYADVPPTGEGSQFYVWVMRLTNRDVIGGYPCGTQDPRSGPCDGQHRPYFRPANQVTRGQAAKIVANTFFPNCQTPARR
ncbi:MAG TPA: S-layer homology domain-containing protein [Chloroflexia bacterium]|nr:S-layer homology domain-containing protein [Chloroflexia bacterium]